MQSIIWEEYKSIEETVKDILGEQDPVVLEFEVFPLDYSVEDVLSPKMFISENKIVFVIDKTIEVYNLKELGISVGGGEPKFTLTQQAFEFCPVVKSTETPLSKNIDIPDDLIRFSITEQGSQPKVFVLRNVEKFAKGYQTWAFAQILKNMQRNYDDYRLLKMVHGNFSFFEGSFLVLAFLIFLVYVFLSVTIGGFLPGFLRAILDFLFGAVCVVVLGWQFWTIFVNVRRYRKIYEAYKPKDNPQSTK